ncbi:solute carrier family 35 member E1-like [Tropilaelaps mercedesae]|uniref:Solute carrier family 35 member E1-like n=1 Tax=Tropilaelaps mercedesae TaxID=418985 RepID=A0A1V9X552_9ACAR|nr:solute carrier family 35 member E1-like [Tropilaelaps mercedesae]
MKLVLLCCVWYSISSTNNVIGKVVLTNLPFPLTVTIVHLGSIALYSGPVLALSGVRPQLEMDWSTWCKCIVPLVLGKFFTSLTSHVSLWKVPVSYAHTVKATMPLFTVILSRIILGQSQTFSVYLSLLPIISGVIIATVTEISFDMIGLIAALSSTIVFALQNIYTKKVMRESGVHHLRLLHILARLALLICLPLWLALDVPRLVRNRELTRHADFITIVLLFVDGFLNFAQNLVAFTMLNMLSPLTYSVCNAAKRICIISFSLLMLHNPVTAANVFGMTLAIFGVLLYNKAKQDAQISKELPTHHQIVTGPAGSIVNLDGAKAGVTSPTTINGFVISKPANNILFEHVFSNNNTQYIPLVHS